MLALVLALAACGEPSGAADPGDASSTGAPALPAPDGYYLPLACGMTVRVGQGNASDFSHNGDLRYAFDLLIDLDTPVHAMAEGVVREVYAANRPGDPCHDGGDQSCQPFANFVLLGHGDGTTSIYKHLNSVQVAVDARVARGAVVGLSGSTGWSTRPHVHVMRMGDCGRSDCPSIPLEFVEAGVPVTGQDVTSLNCP